MNPPESVKPAFNEVNKAKQEQERLINEAQRELYQVVEEAKGEALKLILESEGYALDRVNRAKGDASRFLSIVTEHEKSPELFETRAYLEALTDVLPRISRKFIVDDGAMSAPIPLLQLNKGDG